MVRASNPPLKLTFLRLKVKETEWQGTFEERIIGLHKIFIEFI